MKRRTLINVALIGLRVTTALVLLCLVGCKGEEATDTPIPPAPTATLIPATNTPIPPTPTAPSVLATAIPGIQTVTNIVYYDDLPLDVYLPDRQDRPLPTVLLLHGGGHTKADFAWVASDLVAGGYAAVVPTYRSFLMMDHDAFCALAWLHSNAETYGFDRDRVAVLGFSFGGNLGVLMAAVDEPAEFLQACPYDLPQSGAVQGAISYTGSYGMKESYLTEAGKATAKSYWPGVFGIPSEEVEPLLEALLDTPYERWLDIADFGDNATGLIHMMPQGWIDGSEPPILLIHGSRDSIVDKRESEAFAKLLEAKGVEFQLLIASFGHYMPGSQDETWKTTQAFLAQVLK